MGCDIHWAIEREDIRGNWHTVLSQPYVYHYLFGEYVFNLPYDDYASHPAMLMNNRDYSLFEVLSNVRSENEPSETIAAEGLPEDISDHAEHFLKCDDYHSQGHFDLARLRCCVRFKDPDIFSESIEGHRSAEFLLSQIDALLSDGKSVSTIVFGPDYYEDDYDTALPEMVKASNHEKLRMKRLAEDLKPISDETVRVIIAYDN
jgi:hypothetical protein